MRKLSSLLSVFLLIFGAVYFLQFSNSKGQQIEFDLPYSANAEETSENKSNTNLKNFWLIDPIDGTYDYINDLDEFTINAGLIINNKPAAGLIYAPAKKRMFYSYGENCAFELINEKPVKLDCEKKFDKNEIKFVSYSNKIKPEIEKIHKKYNVKKI